MYKSRGSLDPSDLPNPDAHLLPPVKEIEPQVECVATGRIVDQSSAIDIEGNWVSRSYIDEIMKWHDEIDSFSNKLYDQIDKAYKGDFDWNLFKANIEALVYSANNLKDDAKKMGGVK